MSDNPDVNPDVNPANPGSNDKPGDNGSANTNVNDPARKLQSERDKLRAELDAMRDTVEQLKGQAMGNVFEKAANTFLDANRDKYPDIDAEDLLNVDDLNDEEFEKVAKKAQGRFDRARNKALDEVQSVPDGRLTPEEADKELKQLEKDTRENGAPQGGFQKFLQLKQLRK